MLVVSCPHEARSIVGAIKEFCVTSKEVTKERVAISSERRYIEYTYPLYLYI